MVFALSITQPRWFIQISCADGKLRLLLDGKSKLYTSLHVQGTPSDAIHAVSNQADAAASSVALDALRVCTGVLLSAATSDGLS